MKKIYTWIIGLSLFYNFIFPFILYPIGVIELIFYGLPILLLIILAFYIFFAKICRDTPYSKYFAGIYLAYFSIIYAALSYNSIMVLIDPDSTSVDNYEISQYIGLALPLFFIYTIGLVLVFLSNKNISKAENNPNLPL